MTMRKAQIRPEILHLSAVIGTLTPHPQNVRQGDIGLICQSLQQHGQYRPIVVQKSSNYILAGNHTYRAATALGWSEIAATYVDCDDAQALQIMLADNRTSDMASYDESALADLLTDMINLDALEGTLFDADDLDDLMQRINGTLSFDPPAKDDTSNTDSKTLILEYAPDEYISLMRKLNALRKSMDLETNAQVVATLIHNHKKQKGT
jgi:hypothetical protein